MGLLAETRSRRKLNHDPNNTRWSRDTTTFGQKILRAQGWQPGEFLGAQDAAHSELHTAANATHIRVTLKDDVKGLGFGGRPGEDVPGLDEFSDLLSRLNGKSEAAVDEDRRARLVVKMNAYVLARYGPMRFVRGGLLVGDELKEEPTSEGTATPAERDTTETDSDKKEKKSKKRKATSMDEDDEDSSAKDSEEKSKKRRKEKKEKKEKKSKKRSAEASEETADEENPKAKKKDKKSKSKKSKSRAEEEEPASTAEDDADSAERSAKRKSKSKKKVSSDSADDSSSDSDSKSTKKSKKERKEEKRAKKERKREEKRKKREAGALSESTSGTSSPAPTTVATPAGSGTSTPRNFVRSRFLAAKREAMMNEKALNKIWMVKA